MLETELFNRAREQQQNQRSGGGGGGGGGMQDAAAALRARFWRRESEYLREMRAVKVRGLGAMGMGARTVGGYETVKVLGKGSFGVVRLVRECRRRGRVYAMKVIRKNKMLRTSQEGHLRAERDLLVASEGSRW
jgi:serine/threonine protein kinase